MKEKILITYTSQTGTTAGVAEAIGKTLQNSGLDVDIFPMQNVENVDQYRAVVAGSAGMDRACPEYCQTGERGTLCRQTHNKRYKISR